MSKAITMLLLAGMLGCGDSQPTPRARLLDGHQAQLALELNGDRLPDLNYVKLELF